MEVGTVEGVIQQLVLLARYKYFFYAHTVAPEGADLAAIDAKIRERFQVSSSKFAKYRAAKRGFAKLAYLRLHRDLFLLATHGKSPFFQSEHYHDLRRKPLSFAGYSLSVKNGHVHVCISREQFRVIAAAFRAAAVRLPQGELAARLGSLPFAAYSPIRKQLLHLLKAVNRRRAAFGLAPVPASCLRLRRRAVRVRQRPAT